MTDPMQPNIAPNERLPALLSLWCWHYGLICALPGLAAAALGMIFWASGRRPQAHALRDHLLPRQAIAHE